MKPLVIEMDTPRARDIEEIRRKRLEYFCGPNASSKTEKKTISDSRDIGGSQQPALVCATVKENNDPVINKQLTESHVIRAVEQSEIQRYSSTASDVGHKNTIETNDQSYSDIDTISQPEDEFEDESSEIRTVESSNEINQRSFTNVSKMWDSIMLKQLGKPASSTDKHIADTKSEISDIASSVLAADVDASIVTSSTAKPVFQVLSGQNTAGYSVETSIGLEGQPLFINSAEAGAKPTTIRRIVVTPQDDVAAAIEKLGIYNNFYIEGYLKGLRHALGSDAFMKIVETSADLREILNSMLATQRNVVGTATTGDFHSRPILQENEEAKEWPDSKYLSNNTLLVGARVSDDFPVAAGDASSIYTHTNKHAEQRKRVVSASCAFSADEIYRRAHDISLRESVSGQDTQAVTTTEALDQHPLQYTTTQCIGEHLGENKSHRLDQTSVTRTGMSRDAQSWRDSGKLPIKLSGNEGPATWARQKPERGTLSLNRYFTSLERLNQGQSVTYTDVSAQFEPLPEWTTPREDKQERSENRAVVNTPSDKEKRPVFGSKQRKESSRSSRDKKASIDGIPRPAQSSGLPEIYTSLPPSLSHLVQSSQKNLAGNFQAFHSYDNYFSQLKSSWKNSCIFRDDESMDDFLEKLASKSNNLSDFMQELRSSFDVRKSLDYEVVPGFRQSIDSYVTESGTHVTGLTGKLNKMGVDWTLIREDLMADESKKMLCDTSFCGPDGRRFVVTCPECRTNNRPYITWCLDCGCVLIGVEPTETKKVTAPKDMGLRNDSQRHSASVPMGGDHKSGEKAWPSVSGQSPRRMKKKDSNPELAIHLSLSSSVDHFTGTSADTPEIEVLPRHSFVQKPTAPVPSLHLTESSDSQAEVTSPEVISVTDRESDEECDSPASGVITLDNVSPLPGDEEQVVIESVPNSRVNLIDATTSYGLRRKLDFPTPNISPPMLGVTSPHRPSTALMECVSRPTDSVAKRPMSAGQRGKKVVKSVERVRSADKPRWQSASMEWFVKNKQRTNAWSSGKSMFQEVRQSVKHLETSETAVEPFVLTTREESVHNDDTEEKPTVAADIQNYANHTWTPSRALYQNKEGRFVSRRPFHWTLPKDPFADLVRQSPRIALGDVSFLLTLPDELVLQIFSYLGHRDLARVSRTCRHMHRLAVDESLWRDITVHGRRLNDQQLEEIGSRHPCSLDLTNCVGDDVTPSGVRALLRNGSNLQILTICGCTGGSLTGDVILHTAMSRCPHLTHLNVATTSLSDVALKSLSQSLHMLVSVNLSDNKNICDETVIVLCQKHGKSLESLEMTGCFNITSKSMKAIGQYCKCLTILNLGQCYKITDQSVQQLAPSLGGLQRLDLRGCKQIKDSAVREIVRRCKRLEALILANCQGCTDLAVVEIATYIHNIKYLDMGGCRLVTDVGIRSLAHNCLLLTYLDLSTTGVTHRSVSMLASYCSQRLEVLKLNFCHDITPLALVKLARHCRRLREIHLYGCNTAKNVDRILLENPDLSVKFHSL